MVSKTQTGIQAVLMAGNRRIGDIFRKWRSFSILLILTLSVSLVLNACSLTSKQLAPMRVGITSWAGFDIALYAEDAGLFKQRGLNVELVRFENQQDSARAVLRGSLDAAFASLWDVMQIGSTNDKPAVVMVTNISHGSDGIVTQAKIKSVKDLRGKQVGAKLGTVNHLILLEALKLHQIEPKEVEIKDVSNETAVDLMQKGSLDGAVIWQPLLGETAKQISGNIVFTTQEIDSLVIDVLMTRSTILPTKKAELTQFIAAWFDIMQAIETTPDRVFDTVGKHLKQDGKAFGSDYAGLKKGDIAMQQQMFQSGNRLKQAIAQMSQLLQNDPRAGRLARQDLEINPEPVTAAIALWKR